MVFPVEGLINNNNQVVEHPPLSLKNITDSEELAKVLISECALNSVMQSMHDSESLRI